MKVLSANCSLGTSGPWHCPQGGEVILLSQGGVWVRQKGRAHTPDNFPTDVGHCVPKPTCFNTFQLEPGLLSGGSLGLNLPRAPLTPVRLCWGYTGLLQ